MKAYLHFESGLQVNLQPPIKYISVLKFIDQINVKKDAWFQNYNHFKKKSDLKSYHSSNTLLSYVARLYNNNYRNRGFVSALNIRSELDLSPGNVSRNITISYSIASRYNIISLRGSQIYYNTSKSNQEFYYVTSKSSTKSRS